MEIVESNSFSNVSYSQFDSLEPSIFLGCATRIDYMWAYTILCIFDFQVQYDDTISVIYILHPF
jgi:hypothetical protein